MTAATRTARTIAEKFGLRTESVSMLNTRYSAEHPDAPQFAVVLPDARFASNAPLREADEDALLDMLTTPGIPFVEVDRTPTRVFLAIV